MTAEDTDHDVIPGHGCDAPYAPPSAAEHGLDEGDIPSPAPVLAPAADVLAGARRERALSLPALPSFSAAAEAALSSAALLPGHRNVPEHGWRSMLYRFSRGHWNPGPSAAELLRQELTARARTPISGGYHLVAVASVKGGVGKTTTAVGLGSTLASVRYDSVIAVDCNPDRGTLGDRVRAETHQTVRHLLADRDSIQRRAQIRAYTSQASSRLEILASDSDPAISVAFSEKDFHDVAALLETHYAITLADCGTGLLHSAMRGVLERADQLVLVTSPAVDCARSADATLDWLEAHGKRDLVAAAVVVLSMVRPRGPVNLDAIEGHFAGRCRLVIAIPHDPHLAEGAEVNLDRLRPATRDAYLALAAAVGDGFAHPTPGAPSRGV